MKYLFYIFVSFWLVGCSPPSKFAVDTRFNVPAGYYEEVQIVTWEIGKSVCTELIVSKPHHETKWAATTGLNIKSDDPKTYLSIVLAAREYDPKKLALLIRWVNEDKEKNRIALLKGLPYNKAVPVKIVFSSEDVIEIHYLDKHAFFKVDFKPYVLNIFVSSSASRVQYDVDNCD